MSLSLNSAIASGMLLLGAFGSTAAAQDGVKTMADLERENRLLKLQVDNLSVSLGVTLAREETKTASLKKIKEQMALFGKDFFEDGDAKHLQAVSDYQVARENLNQLEAATFELIPAIRNYLRTAVASEPDARADVEVKIRELEVALGQRKQPKRKIEQGTAQEARIVTIDSNTGLVVVNAGHDADLSVGMRFRIERSGSHIGDAIVAATRPDVSGLLMQTLINQDNQVRPGDTAKLILNN
ncbi:hypothetical protein N9A86_01835 [Akkermansiaceae bacterium]|nr:hypothetical protein [Akkermansiaceae bacterium]MDB4537034.1 hypothetical protein [Akkermansiaceae bacterium]